MNTTFYVKFFDCTENIKFSENIHNCECFEISILSNYTFSPENKNECGITDYKSETKM